MIVRGLLVAVSALVWACGALGRHVVVNKDSMMPTEDVTLKKEGLAACKCLKQCFVLPECQAVSVERTVSTTCYFTTHGGVNLRLVPADAAPVPANNPVQVPADVLNSETSCMTIVKKGCAPGFVSVGAFCYFFSKDNVTYNEAVKQCPSGSSLAFPSTENQRKALSTFVNAEMKNNQWYVDVTQRSERWFWSDGTEIAEANLGTSATEPCARLIANTNTLFDIPCWSTYPYICQYQAVV